MRLPTLVLIAAPIGVILLLALFLLFCMLRRRRRRHHQPIGPLGVHCLLSLDATEAGSYSSELLGEQKGPRLFQPRSSSLASRAQVCKVMGLLGSTQTSPGRSKRKMGTPPSKKNQLIMVPSRTVSAALMGGSPSAANMVTERMFDHTMYECPVATSKGTGTDSGYGKLFFSVGLGSPDGSQLRVIINRVENIDISADAVCVVLVEVYGKKVRKQTVLVTTDCATDISKEVFFDLPKRNRYKVKVLLEVMKRENGFEDQKLGYVIHSVPIHNRGKQGPYEMQSLSSELRCPFIAVDRRDIRVCIGLSYLCTAGRLIVAVLGVRQMKSESAQGDTEEMLVKAHLLVDGRVFKSETFVERLSGEETSIDHPFTFFMLANHMSAACLSLRFYLRLAGRSKKELVGRLEFGAGRVSNPDCPTIWDEMLSRPREKVTRWYQLM